MPCFKAAREQRSDYGSPNSNTELKYKIDFKIRSKPGEDAQIKISMISKFENFSYFTMNVDLSDIYVNFNSGRIERERENERYSGIEREREKIKTEQRGVRTGAQKIFCAVKSFLETSRNAAVKNRRSNLKSFSNWIKQCCRQMTSKTQDRIGCFIS